MRIKKNGEYIDFHGVGDDTYDSLEDLLKVVAKKFPGVPHSEISLYIDSNGILSMRNRDESIDRSPDE